jgi:electron transport complex protein RnfG
MSVRRVGRRHRFIEAVRWPGELTTLSLPTPGDCDGIENDMHNQLKVAGLIGLLICFATPRGLHAEGSFFTTSSILKDFFRESERVNYVDVMTERAAGFLREQLGYVPAKAKYTVFTAWSGKRIDGYAVLDEERGQHLPIHFATKLGPDGRVLRTEVMAYGESYGEEIREARFRAQYVGKGGESRLKLGDDVVAISGATISSRSMTVAVKRAVALVDWLRAHASDSATSVVGN